VCEGRIERCEYHGEGPQQSCKRKNWDAPHSDLWKDLPTLYSTNLMPTLNADYRIVN
jgi:hypothetical protein